MAKLPPNPIKLDTQKLTQDAKRLARRHWKNPYIWVVVIGTIIYLAVNVPNWERKSDLYAVLKSGRAGYICLAHQNNIFERSGMNKAYATTKSYIRFDRDTFIRDFLKQEGNSIGMLAVAVDLDRVVTWAELNEKEIFALSKSYKVEMGTCISATGLHYSVPGAVWVTNQ